jgi:hypothetical protein
LLFDDRMRGIRTLLSDLLALRRCLLQHGSEASVGGTAQENMANTVVLAKFSGEPDAQTVRFTIQQLW